MKVLIGCEESGKMRDAFIAAGHDAISCDLMPTRSPGPHIQGDIMELKDEHFDLGIFHPVCRYLTNSGVRWLHSDITRWPKLFEAAEFFNSLKEFNCDRIAIENPKPHKYARALIGKYTQSVQPYIFGDMRTKETCWWLYNLPNLIPTDDVKEAMLLLPKSESHACHYASPGPDRERTRSESHPGMCAAAASQWAQEEIHHICFIIHKRGANMTKIEKRIEILQDISARIAGLLQAIADLRDTGAQEIEDNGKISEETCAKMASLMASLHEETRKLYTGGYSVHQSLSRFIPEDANEGSKPWPP